MDTWIYFKVILSVYFRSELNRHKVCFLSFVSFRNFSPNRFIMYNAINVSVRLYMLADPRRVRRRGMAKEGVAVTT